MKKSFMLVTIGSFSMLSAIGSYQSPGSMPSSQPNGQPGSSNSPTESYTNPQYRGNSSQSSSNQPSNFGSGNNGSGYFNSTNGSSTNPQSGGNPGYSNYSGNPSYSSNQGSSNYSGSPRYANNGNPGSFTAPGSSGSQSYPNSSNPGYSGNQTYQPYNESNYQNSRGGGDNFNNQQYRPNSQPSPSTQYNDKSFYQLSHQSNTDQNNSNSSSGNAYNKKDDQIAQNTLNSSSRNTINTDVSPGDKELSKNVHEVLYGWFSTGNQNVSFEVNEGKVTLTGAVNSQEEKNKIEQNVKKIQGVTEVNNKITVTDLKKVAYYQPQGSNTSNNAKNTLTKPKDYAALDADKKINSQIRDKLNNHSFDAVSIITANGVVTLAGNVGNPDDLRVVITEIEKVDGVKKVNNKTTEKK